MKFQRSFAVSVAVPFRFARGFCFGILIAHHNIKQTAAEIIFLPYHLQNILIWVFLMPENLPVSGCNFFTKLCRCHLSADRYGKRHCGNVHSHGGLLFFRAAIEDGYAYCNRCVLFVYSCEICHNRRLKEYRLRYSAFAAEIIYCFRIDFGEPA